jgi:hypothetical protein
MEITSPEAMSKFADDVRAQEAPFTKTASEAFTALFGAEYKRLRAAGLESGENSAVLNCTVRCNFDPERRSIEIITTPAPTNPKPRRRAVSVPDSR